MTKNVVSFPWRGRSGEVGNMTPDSKRWNAHIVWSVGDELVSGQWLQIEEIEDLQAEIENGPAWVKGMQISVKLSYNYGE